MSHELANASYLVSTDRSRVDLDAVHAFLSQRSYWAAGISRERLANAIENSLPFGVYRDAEQVGFARVVTDYETFAYLADVYIDEAHRGRGLSKLLMEAVAGHPRLQSLRRWMLGTRDAHSLYAQFGFIPIEEPARWMERPDQHSYTARTAANA
jgi:GNAT superfamily N-acetyltransferase